MKKLLLSAVLFLFACQKQEVNLVFNTQNVSDRAFVLESHLKVLSHEESSERVHDSMNSKLHVRVKSSLLSAYDDGSGRFLMKVDSVQYNSDKRSVEEFRHIERYISAQDFQFKMGPDGQMTALSMEEYAPIFESGDLDIRKLFLKVQPVLPSSPVKVGASWERQHLIAGENESPDLFVYKWFKMEDLFVRDGITFARLKMNIKYRQETEDEHHKMESSGFVLGSGDLLFNVSEGMIEEGSLEINGKLRVHEKMIGETFPEMRVLQVISLRSFK